MEISDSTRVLDGDTPARERVLRRRDRGVEAAMGRRHLGTTSLSFELFSFVGEELKPSMSVPVRG